MTERTSSWYVYILRCSDNTLYTGITTNLRRRLHQHNNLKSAAKYTKVRRPNTLIYAEIAEDRSSASQREYELKRLKRTEKQKIISQKTSRSIDISPFVQNNN